MKKGIKRYIALTAVAATMLITLLFLSGCGSRTGAGYDASENEATETVTTTNAASYAGGGRYTAD